jgi:hypothetical protein
MNAIAASLDRENPKSPSRPMRLHFHHHLSVPLLSILHILQPIFLIRRYSQKLSFPKCRHSFRIVSCSLSSASYFRICVGPYDMFAVRLWCRYIEGAGDVAFLALDAASSSSFTCWKRDTWALTEGATGALVTLQKGRVGVRGWTTLTC